jgi:hypothetical protein
MNKVLWIKDKIKLILLEKKNENIYISDNDI